MTEQHLPPTSLVKEYDYPAQIVNSSLMKKNGNLEHAKKLIITPIELGNSIEFRGKDDRVILRIPIKSISHAYKTTRIIKYWFRKALDLLIKVQFRDQQQNEQTVVVNVEDRYVDAIVNKITELKDVDNQEYWLKRTFILADPRKIVTIRPRTPFLGENEKVLWINEELDEVTNKNTVKLQVITDVRVFEYDFKTHVCHYLALSDLDDIKISNKKWISSITKINSKKKTTIVGDLTFVSQQKTDIMFSDVNDPYSLARLVKEARNHFVIE